MAGVTSLTAAACNSMLGLQVKSAILGAGIAFSIGSVLLLAGVFLTAPATGAFEFSRRPKPWELAGGFCGALYMVTVVWAAPELGAAGLFSAVVAGQLASSVLVDWVGLNGQAPVPLTVYRTLCVLFAALGASLTAPGAHDAPHSTPHAHLTMIKGAHSSLTFLAIATAAAGAMQPLQAALNARVATIFGGADGSPRPLPAAAISFSLSALLTLTTGVFLLKHDIWANLSTALLTAPPIALFGAPAQALTLLAGATIPRYLGTANYYTLLICGEMAGGLVADAVGMMGLEQKAPTAPRVGGAVLICIAAAALGLLTKKPEVVQAEILKKEASSSTAVAESISLGLAVPEGCKFM